MVSNTTFIDDKSYQHLEIGAGCGNFGNQFYPKCYLTDENRDLVKICQDCKIDWFCNAHSLTWSDNRFEKIIICNPFGFGFATSSSTKLISELVRVSKNACEIIIIGRWTNKYCPPYKIEKSVERFMAENEGVSLKISKKTFDFDEYPRYIFRKTDFTETIPQFKLIIHVTK